MIDFIAYLKTLKAEDWDKKATAKWTVKDVVAHMVGWERVGVDWVKKAWETKERPWSSMDDKATDDFNDKWVEFYKNYLPDQLISEWEMWQKKVGEEIDKIGYENIKTRPDLFSWLLESEEEATNNDREESHYEHHLNQIKRAVE